MVLHIYNPEHDIALAKNDAFFTAPKAAMRTRQLFCHVPAFWANDGDWILVDDISQAKKNLEGISRTLPVVEFVTLDCLAKLSTASLPEKIEPWGWDKKIVATLLRCNPLLKSLLPTDEQLDDIRRMSSRQFAAEMILPELIKADERLTGEMIAMSGNADEIVEKINSLRPVVVKSPWSCSGRGVRFIVAELTASEKGWIANTLKEQGVIMAEPMYDKMKDFAMEFLATKQGVKYLGLNIFETSRGQYLQNSAMTEQEKKAELSEFIDCELIDKVKDKLVEITSRLFLDRYEGPFGVDMMIVKTADNITKIHPCVELNLRRTMGHIGLYR